ncbi:hypothetical protein Tco_0489407 [Tanacetum coccineum]
MLGFSGEQVKSLGKIELDGCFGGDGLCKRAIMKFIVISAPSPYNIILGHLGLKQLKAIPSTIHGMMKFPTPLGVATLVSQTAMMFECRIVGKKQAEEPAEKEKPQEKNGSNGRGTCQYNLSGPNGYDRQKSVTRRLYPAKKSAQKEQGHFCMGTIRHDGSAKKNHQTFPQRQLMCCRVDVASLKSIRRIESFLEYGPRSISSKIFKYYILDTAYRSLMDMAYRSSWFLVKCRHRYAVSFLMDTTYWMSE